MAAEQSEYQVSQTKEPIKEIKTKTGSRGKRREQNDRAIRGIIGKINTRLKEDKALSKEEWLGLVKDAVQLAKALGMAKNAKKPIPSAASNLF